MHETTAHEAPADAPPARAAAAAGTQIAEFALANGMRVVTIPDHRAPVVTHMVWYRNGSADDPPGKSGIAHFLEHLMFKGTARHPMGEFSDVVAKLGGQENAFTSNDYTAYFQRVAREHLGAVMAFEADRMTGLALTDEVVAPERDVVLEERRMHCDSDPGTMLNEAVQNALFQRHPYGAPIIGWGHEVAELTRDDALAYYRRFYGPGNAILVVAGDVEAEEVRALAEQTYGALPAAPEPDRSRPREPEPTAHRLVTLEDPKVEQPMCQRVYLAPSYRTAAPGVAEAHELLAHLLGGGQTSLIYRRLVVERKVAVAAGAHYQGGARDQTRFWVYAVPKPDVTLAALDAAVEEAVAEARAAEFPAEEVERAKTRLVADAIYAQDNQASLARMYGAALAVGSSVEDVRAWPERIEAVTAAQVAAAARATLVKKRAVTGFLEREEAPR
ncbi:MAG: insulinase family protein [Hyphomicrobiales bacterium]|nr:insulinase family protein [Hyphomicrobiales bacterium]